MSPGSGRSQCLGGFFRGGWAGAGLSFVLFLLPIENLKQNITCFFFFTGHLPLRVPTCVKAPTRFIVFGVEAVGVGKGMFFAFQYFLSPVI